MSLLDSKRGFGEMHYIIFLVVFFAFMGIIGSIFIKTTVDQKLAENSDSFIVKIISTVSDVVGNIPVVGQFWNLVKYSYGFSYVHPYLATIYVALVGAPFGYMVLRLTRGGG